MTPSKPGTRLGLGVLVLGVLIAGCGGAGETLDLGNVPLAPSSRVVAQRYACPVTPEQCFRYAIVGGARRTTPRQLKAAQRTVLAQAGWQFTDGVTPHAVAADSPDRKTFISFETGGEEIADERTRNVDWNATLGQRLRKEVASGQAVLAITLEKLPPN